MFKAVLGQGTRGVDDGDDVVQRAFVFEGVGQGLKADAVGVSARNGDLDFGILGAHVMGSKVAPSNLVIPCLGCVFNAMP